MDQDEIQRACITKMNRLKLTPREVAEGLRGKTGRTAIYRFLGGYSPIKTTTPQHAELPAAIREARRQMDAARHHASLIGMILDDLGELPGRDFFEFAKVRQALGQIEQSCKVARPAITCPACNDSTGRAHCLTCKGRGWLSEIQKQQVSK